MTAANNEDQPRITAAELAEVIAKHPDWADLPVHMLNMTDDAVWLTEVEYDCFDVNEGPVLSLLAHAPAVPGGQPAPSYGVVLARAEAAERQVDELLAEVEHLRAESAGSEQQMRERIAAELACLPIVQRMGITGCDLFVKRVAETALHYAATMAMNGGVNNA